MSGLLTETIQTGDMDSILNKSAAALPKTKESVVDDLDQRLIAELRVNARATVPALASILGVARGTVQARLNKLVAAGVIAGFTVKLRENRPDALVRGVMMIELAGRNIKPAVASLRRNPGAIFPPSLVHF